MSKKKTSTTPAPASGPGTAGWFPRVGEVWPGQGIYCGIVRGEAGKPDHHLFASTDEITYNAKVAWGPRDIDAKGATHERDGLANTSALNSHKATHPAAKWAASVHAEGHTDWYLPSRRELRLLWVNVPELFESGWYWSSTQFSPYLAWNQYFGGGNQNGNGKAYEGRARAVRRFVIE
jgi:hypothetical protein